MANTSSAQKAIRSQVKRHKRNSARKEAYKSARKEVLQLLNKKDTSKLVESTNAFFKAVDKAAKTNAISANAAARYKSRLATKIAAISK
ncbi:MAG: 30S ribosomal protein S20 [Candidatus Doudnabacteria bacterium]|nr:30S ribosomal protein S20 [Candidatus Doudnabacteria bacterium]